MAEIDGKAVEFADRLPARQWWTLYPRLVSIKAGDSLMDALGWDNSVALCRAVVVSWEFDGDPNDPAAYEQMHFPAMAELVGKAFIHAIGLLNQYGAASLGE